MKLLADAVKRGCRHFLIGIGGSATNDGGIGMLQALGFGMLDENGNQVEFGAKGLRQLKSITTSHVLPELSKMYIPCCLRCHKSTLRLYWLQCCFWTAKGS